jgi:type III secretion protein S
MDPTLLALGREALLLVLWLSVPPLSASLVVGLATGVVQAATQVQEQTLSAVPRIAAAFAALAVSGPWIGAQVVRFASSCLDLVPRVAP